jgi:hypothetical protein
MTPLTTKARAALEGTTPGPWTHDAQLRRTNVRAGGIYLAECDCDAINASEMVANAAFIAAAPSLVRELCEEVERLRAERDAMRQAAPVMLTVLALLADEADRVRARDQDQERQRRAVRCDRESAMTYSKSKCLDLAEQCEVDDRRMTAAPWDGGSDWISFLDEDGERLFANWVGEVQLGWFDNEAVARTRNSLPEIAAALRAAVGEVERRPTEFAFSQLQQAAYQWQSDCHKAEADRDRLAKRVEELERALTEACDIAEQHWARRQLNIDARNEALAVVDAIRAAIGGDK